MLTNTCFQIAPVLITWSDAYRAWLETDHIKKGGGTLSGKAIQAYLQDLRHYAAFHLHATGADFSPELLTPASIQAYFSAQDASHVPPASRNRRLASLRIFVRWCVLVGLLDADPTVRIARVDNSKLPPRAKSADECKALSKVVKRGQQLKKKTARHQVLGLRDQVILGLFNDAGLRISSVAALDIEGLHLGEGWISVWVKGGKIGEIVIPKRLCKLLSEWLKVRPGPASGAVITDWDGQRLSTGQIRRRLYAIGEAAGVAVQPHDLRHTYIYRLMDQALEGDRPLPAALDLVRQQACHSDSRTTMTYLRARREDLHSAVERM
jgi:site-specific recombinase XerC